MNIAIVNASSFPGLADALPRIVEALEVQVVDDYAPIYRRLPPGVLVVADASKVAPRDWPCFLVDEATVADSLGYHSTTEDGRPVLVVETGPIAQAGGTLLDGPASVSAVLSHEILETLEDGDAGEWYEGPGGILVAREVCDPCQGDAYAIDGVTVSAFVTPAWFRGGAGPMVFARGRELACARCQVRPSGYMIVREPGQAGEQTVWGERAPWRRAERGHGARRAGAWRPRP